MTEFLLAHATSTEWSAIAMAFAAGTVVGGLAVGGIATASRYFRR